MELGALQAWLDAYARAWEEGDADLAASASLYAEDVTYWETPFDEPLRGLAAIRAYAVEAAEAQGDVAVRCTALAVAGDLGIARWQATFTRVASAAHVELDGVFLLRFDAEGRCREFREWWHRREEANRSSVSGGE